MDTKNRESNVKALDELVVQMEWRVVPLRRSHVQALIEEGFDAYYSAPAGKVATALLTLARLVLDEATPGRAKDPEASETSVPVCRIPPLEDAMNRWADCEEEGRKRLFTILDAMGGKDPAARAAHALLAWAAQTYELARRIGAKR